LQGLSYPLFPQYVVNIEILEEITFLNTAQGGGLTLDITPGEWGWFHEIKSKLM
jgi:hypothetical protein